MAHGDPILSSGTNNWSDIKGTRVEKYLLLDGADDAAGANATGAWVRVHGAVGISGSVIASSVTSGATIQIRGKVSPDGAAPSASDDGFQIGGDIAVTANGETDFRGMTSHDSIDYIKAIVSAHTDGSYDVPVTVTKR